MDVPDKMLAAFLVEKGRLELREAPVPKPGPVDVLIRVEACAVCHSDVDLISNPWPGQPPFGNFIPGHEYAGVVVARGETVDEFEIGDRVAVEAHLGCLRCRNCRIGNYTACLNYGNVKKGHRANGFTTNGGYAQYVINHINTVHKIADHVSFDEASLVTNLGCVLYGFQTIGGYVVGEHVVVMGPGPLGLASVAVAKLLGAERVYLVGTRESRLKVGKVLGADRLINIHEENPVEVVMDETRGIGADLVIESSGSTQGPQTAIDMTKRMGKILMLGFPSGPVTANFAQMGRDNKTIFTVRGEGWANCERAVSLLNTGKIDLKPLVTHTFPLEKIHEAFDTFIKRKEGAIKVVVRPGEKGT